MRIDNREYLILEYERKMINEEIYVYNEVRKEILILNEMSSTIYSILLKHSQDHITIGDIATEINEKLLEKMDVKVLKNDITQCLELFENHLLISEN